MPISPSQQASKSRESMSKSRTCQPAVLSNITNLSKLGALNVGEPPDLDSTAGYKASRHYLSSRLSVQPLNRTAGKGGAKHRPSALDLGLRHLKTPPPTVSTASATSLPIPTTPALTYSSISIGTESIDTLEVELHHHRHERKVTKGSTLHPARHGYGGTSHSKTQLIEMFSPKNTMSYLTSPQGAQASHQCNQDISEAFIQLKLDYRALAHDWPIENENYAIRVSSDLGMKW